MLWFQENSVGVYFKITLAIKEKYFLQVWMMWTISVICHKRDSLNNRDWLVHFNLRFNFLFLLLESCCLAFAWSLYVFHQHLKIPTENSDVIEGCFKNSTNLDLAFVSVLLNKRCLYSFSTSRPCRSCLTSGSYRACSQQGTLIGWMWGKL